jgi:hypothetical protein
MSFGVIFYAYNHIAIVIIWLVILVYRLVFSSLMPNSCDICGNVVVALINSISTIIAAVVIPLSIMIPLSYSPNVILLKNGYIVDILSVNTQKEKTKHKK